MDRRIVADKLESLRRCIARVEAMRPDTVETLRSDVDLQDILSVNLMRAVQVCVDLAAHLVADLDGRAPETMADLFTVLEQAEHLSPEVASRMRSAVGFRNVAVHVYQSIDWDVVFAIADDHLDDFRAFAAAVVELTTDPT